MDVLEDLEISGEQNLFRLKIKQFIPVKNEVRQCTNKIPKEERKGFEPKYKIN